MYLCVYNVSLSSCYHYFCRQQCTLYLSLAFIYIDSTNSCPAPPQIPVDSVPDGVACGDGLGVDRHHPQPVQLDLCGGHLRQHLHHQV